MMDEQKNNLPVEEQLPTAEEQQASSPSVEEALPPATQEPTLSPEGIPQPAPEVAAPSPEGIPQPAPEAAAPSPEGISQPAPEVAAPSPEGVSQPVPEVAAPSPEELPHPTGEEPFAQPGEPSVSQPVEADPPSPQEPEYPRQQGTIPQQPWPGYGPQPGAVPPQEPWAGYAPYGAYAAPQPPMYPATPHPYGYPGMTPPKKKMSLGLKVFLWITSVLVAGTILGFTGFVVSWAIAGPGIQDNLVETLPSPPQQEEQPSQQQQEEEEAPQIEMPDVDVTPNEEGITIYQKPQGDPLEAQEIYEKVRKSTVAITASYTGESTDSSGTGIIATSDGYIITNAHVVLNSKSVLVTVTTYDGQQYDAVVVGVDRTTDLAVIKTNDYQFTPAEFGDASELFIGEWVLAIGNPGGERFASSLTRGIISGLDRAVERYSEEGMTFIQTDAAINPGNSGGPLVNMYGQVVGINSSKIITEGYEGMGFAIPVSKAKDIIDQLLSGGYVEGRVRLGISGYDLNGTAASLYGVPQGFMIASIDEESAFTGTQAQVNDIIVAVDGEPVQELADISNLLLRYQPGDQVTITLYRMGDNAMEEGQEIDVVITLLEDKGETQK